MARLKIKKKERFPEGWHNVVRSQIERAIENLRAEGDDFDEGIHNARTCCKKIRSALRLVRDEIGNKTYQRENAFFRDTAQQISAIRDAQVNLDTIDMLRAKSGGHLRTNTVTEIRRILKSRLIRAENKMHEECSVLVELQDQLHSSIDRIEAMVIRDDFNSIAPGLIRVYKRGREDFELVQKKPKTENYHDWRKRVKYLRYQLNMLRPLWPAVMKTMESETKELSNLQGVEHDLAVLEELLLSDEEIKPHMDNAKTLLKEIASRRKKLKKQFIGYGIRIYGELPKCFLKRHKEYWQAWKR